MGKNKEAIVSLHVSRSKTEVFWSRSETQLNGDSKLKYSMIASGTEWHCDVDPWHDMN